MGERRQGAQSREARDQRERIVVLCYSGISYALDALWLGLLAMQGVTSLRTPAAYIVAVAVPWTIFLVYHLRGWNLRLRDPTMTAAQSGLGYAVALTFLAAAPEAGFVLLAQLFIVAGFGILTTSVRQSALNFVLVAAAAAGIIAWVGERLQIPVATPGQRAVAWFTLISALAQVMFLSNWVNQLRWRLRDRNLELKSAFARIEQLASVDELTQAWNRRTFRKLVEDEALHAARFGSSFCIALLDLDHFKAVNDRFGHAAGDQVLKTFAGIVLGTIRATDRLGRYGGEEFILLLPQTLLKSGLMIVERVRAEVARHDWSTISPGLTVTVSAGISSLGAGEAVEDTIRRCDVALYEAKAAGRNRTMVGDDE
jgi:diguanylate cyclase (GGDEF)-like protein